MGGAVRRAAEKRIRCEKHPEIFQNGDKMQETEGSGSTTVLVLMSTYNGERYMGEQLDSILGQEKCGVRLLIRDDGSTDATRELLRKYRNGPSGKQILPLMEGENIGAVQSFFALLRAAVEFPYEYYALADQDDIWLADKLFTAVNAIGQEEQPCLYASAVQPVNGRGNCIPAGIRYPQMRPAFGNALVENICTGCTCVMNRQMLLLAAEKVPEFTVMHDFWLYLLASAFGRVVYDEQPHILYRQHGGNTVGMAATAFENYKRRLRNFKRHRGQLRHQAGEFEKLYGKELETREHEKAGLLRNFVAGKRKLMFDKKVYRQRRSDNFIMKLLLMLGWL